MTPSTPAPAPRACHGCGALVPDVAGPVNEYVPRSRGCWMTFGEVQADEPHRFGCPDVHRVVVDAYMAQHPGDGADRRDGQSAFVHLVGLCAALEHALPPPYATALLGRTTWMSWSAQHDVIRAELRAAFDASDG